MDDELKVVSKVWMYIIFQLLLSKVDVQYL